MKNQQLAVLVLVSAVAGCGQSLVQFSPPDAGAVDATAPTVRSTSPPDRAVGMALNTHISVTFSEAMRAASLDARTFTVTVDASPVPGEIRYEGVTATFVSGAAFVAESLVEVRVTTGATDLAGNPLAGDYTWSFTTGLSADETPPRVLAAHPTDGEARVSLDVRPAVIFDEAMNAATLEAPTFTVAVVGGARVEGFVAYDASTLSAVFVPAAPLLTSTFYIATISPAASDTAGNTLARPFVWQWSTGPALDTIAPVVTSTGARSGATGLPVNRAASATFSEPMAPATLSATTFTLSHGATSIAGTVTYAGVTAVLRPVALLAANTTYIARITTGATDLAGNTLARPHEWFWTTGSTPDGTAPVVTSTSPADGAVDSPINRGVSATFSEPMDPLSLTSATFTVTRAGTPVEGSVSYSGVTATFTPSSALAFGATFTATLHAGATDLAGNAMTADRSWSWTTGSAPDVLAPTVSSTVPPRSSVGVPFTANVAVVFSEPMDPLSINALSLNLQREGLPVVGTVTYSGVTATFDPQEDLAANTTYVAEVTTGVTDLAGNALAVRYAWSFTTGPAADTEAPSVSGTFPVDGAIGTPLGGHLSITFSEAMEPLTVTTLTVTLERQGTPVAGTVTYAGTTATFVPLAALEAGTTYLATVSVGAEDLAGNALAAPYRWSFTTGPAADTVAPAVSSTFPAAEARGIPIGGNIAVTFTEVMNPLTVTTASFTLQQGATVIPGTVSYVGTTATFNPSSALMPNTRYAASVTTAMTDLAGNALVANFVWSFTTGLSPDTTRPTATSNVPAGGATGVALGANVAVTFSEAMTPSSLTTATFVLRRGGVVVPGTVSYAGTTATFNPTTDLLPDTVYTATVTTGARDLAGNPLAVDLVWTFRTGVVPDTTRPFVVATLPADAQTAVSLNSKVSATFSEAMEPSTVTTTTFILERAAVRIAGTVNYLPRTATFTPSLPLQPDTEYRATVTTGVRDLSGNSMLVAHVWTFSTGLLADADAPLVVSTNPADEGSAVAVDASVNASFSEAMDPLTVTTGSYVVTGPGGAQVAGTVSYDVASRLATFRPTSDLLANTTFTATLAESVADLAGNPLGADFVWTFTTAGPGTHAGPLQVMLLSTAPFAILAGAGVTNTGLSIINGDLGTSPTGSVDGFPPGIVNGSIHAAPDPVATQAKLDLTIAFNDAQSRSTSAISLPGDLSGLTFFPGLYVNSTSVMLSAGAVTLDAQGDGNAVFIFVAGSTLTTGAGTQVVLSGGAKAANIFWSVGTSATLGTSSTFKGNILADQAISMATGAVLDGRALTRIASVTLQSNIVTLPLP